MADGVIPEDVIAFLLERAGGMLCTCDAHLRPSAHEFLVTEAGPWGFEGIVPGNLAGPLTENARATGAASLVISRVPGDHRSVQVKGRIVEVGPLQVRQLDPSVVEPLVPMFGTVMGDDQARFLLLRWIATPTMTVRVEATEVYDQTPGPLAGRAIAGGAP